MKRIVLGINIDSITCKDCLSKISEFIEQKTPSQISTVNPEFIVAAQKDSDFRHILNQSALAIPDGFGLMLAGKVLKEPFAERITGVDLSWKIFELASQKGYSIFLLGAQEGIARKAAGKILEKYPNLKIAGYYAGHPEDKNIIELIEETKPDILLVAYGAPKQEKFIYYLMHNREINHIPYINVGVGGTFDYIAGVQPYAPKWMRKIGLEWLYRLFTQPKRFKRILTATVLFPLMVIFRHPKA